MFNKVKGFLSIDFVKVSLWTGISTIVKILTNLGLSKYLAVMIGPSGLALIGQLNNLSSIILTISTASSSQGITKYTAELKENKPELYNSFIINTTKVVLAISIVCSLVVWTFAIKLSIIAFGTESFKLVFQLFSLNIVLFSAYTILMATINGLKEYKKFVNISIVGSIFGFVLTLLLVYLYNITGALISSIASQSLMFFYTAYKSKSIINSIVSNWLKYRINKKVLLMLFSFSLMSIISMIIVPFGQFIIRGEIIQKLGQSDAGFWEAINRVTNMYLMIVTATIPVYYLPKLSELKSNIDIVEEVTKTFKFVIPVVVVVGTLIFTLKSFLIRILFSTEFNPMENMFLPQQIGDLFKVSSWLLAYTLIAKAKISHFIFLEIIGTVLYIVLVTMSIDTYGMSGVMWSYTLTYIIYFFAVLYFFRLNFVRNE